MVLELECSIWTITHPATILHHVFQLCFAFCGDAGPDCVQAIVFTCANLDSAYFVLLDHFLTCGWAAPPVPPPHEYFPALAALYPGLCRLHSRIALCSDDAAVESRVFLRNAL